MTGFNTADMSVFGLVPDGRGGYMTDPQDSIDARKKIAGYNASRGAWGANIKDPALQGFAVSPSDLRAAGIPEKLWGTSQVEATNPLTGVTVKAPIVDKLGTPGRVDATYATYGALGGPQERGGGLARGVNYRIVGMNQAEPVVMLNGANPRVMTGDAPAPSQVTSTPVVPTEDQMNHNLFGQIPERRATSMGVMGANQGDITPAGNVVSGSAPPAGTKAGNGNNSAFMIGSAIMGAGSRFGQNSQQTFHPVDITPAFTQQQLSGITLGGNGRRRVYA